ncbi:MAG: hypothetical protein CM1200mP29_03950 [Verrucomicrobiota bacterium]|nr:MAG: hypothetical protein CM1200mP29_03950 [Verrucomicrobiota bacterium]
MQDGPGKAPELAKRFVGDDPFLLTYGDILCARRRTHHGRALWPKRVFRPHHRDTRRGCDQGRDQFFRRPVLPPENLEKPSTEQLDQLRADGWLKEGDPMWYKPAFTSSALSYSSTRPG